MEMQVPKIRIPVIKKLTKTETERITRALLWWATGGVSSRDTIKSEGIIQPD